MKLKEVSRQKSRFDDVDRVEYKVEDNPRVVFGHTVINPEFGLIMTFEGLRDIMKEMTEGDCLRIIMHAGNDATEYFILKDVKKGDEHDAGMQKNMQ